MTLNRDDPLDRLYLETIPQRITPPDPQRMEDGPTAAFARLTLARELWALLPLFDVDEVPAA